MPSADAGAEATPVTSPNEAVFTHLLAGIALGLDDLLSLTQLPNREKTYSAPLAIRQFTKETELINGRFYFPRLQQLVRI